MSLPPPPTGRRLGPWVADDDVYSGDPVFGNASGTVATPQQFVNAVFLSPPYYSTMLWTGGLSSSASLGGTPLEEAQWLNEVLTICDKYTNIAIEAMFFININGHSWLSHPALPPASTGLSNVGFTVKHANDHIAMIFIFAATAGLSASTTYQLDLLDPTLTLIANITSFTTDATGAATITVNVPDTTDAQANAGGYVVVRGTGVGCSIGWQNDQSANFQQYMQTIAGHTSLVACMYEQEYYGNTLAITSLFKSTVNNAGYYNLVGYQQNTTNDLVAFFSAYPFNGAPLPIQSVPPGVTLQYQIGFDGTPNPPDPSPIWNPTNVLAIVNQTTPVPSTIIIIREDNSNVAFTQPPAYADASGNDFYLYMSPVVRNLIWNDPYYQANYLLANGQISTTKQTHVALTPRQV